MSFATGSRRDVLRTGEYFTVALIVSFAALSAVAWVMLRLLRMASRGNLPSSLRHGIANLYRPGAHAQSVLVALGVGGMPYAQEVVFLFSMAVVIGMLVLVTRPLAPETRRAILFTSIIIFAFRATPSVGDGYFWWTLDQLQFDEAFYGTLRQTAAIIAIAAMWLFSKQLTEYSVTAILFWLAVAGAVLSLPNIGLFYGLHHWTEATFGFGARTIAVVDAATSSPFAQISMIPLLTLVAFYAPAGHRATWFALMASLMNMALVAGQLQTRYLNEIFVVGRGNYTELGPLLITAAALGLLIPVAAITLFGRRV